MMRVGFYKYSIRWNARQMGISAYLLSRVIATPVVQNASTRIYELLPFVRAASTATNRLIRPYPVRWPSRCHRVWMPAHPGFRRCSRRQLWHRVSVVETIHRKTLTCEYIIYMVHKVYKIENPIKKGACINHECRAIAHSLKPPAPWFGFVKCVYDLIALVGYLDDACFLFHSMHTLTPCRRYMMCVCVRCVCAYLSKSQSSAHREPFSSVDVSFWVL